MDGKELSIEIMLQSKAEIVSRFRDTVRWQFFISTIFGVCPLSHYYQPPSITKHKCSQHQVFVWIHRLWSGFLLVSIGYCMYLYYISAYESDLNRNVIAKLLEKAEDGLSALSCIVIVFNSHIYMPSYYKDYILEIIEIDCKFASIGCQLLDHRQVRKFIRRVTLTAILILIFVFIAILYYNVGNLELTVRVTISYIMPNWMIVLTLIQFAIQLFIVAERYQQISGHLLKINVNPLSNQIECDEVVKKLQMLSKIYFTLNELDINANASFGVLMVIQVITSFTVICTQFFNFYAATLRPNGLWLTSGFTVLWLVFHGGKVWLFLALNSKIEDEVSFRLGLFFYF